MSTLDLSGQNTSRRKSRLRSFSVLLGQASDSERLGRGFNVHQRQSHCTCTCLCCNPGCPMCVFDRTFNRILEHLTSPRFYRRYVKLPQHDHTPPEIRQNPRFYPYFCSVHGALDCTHLDAWVPADALARYRDHKGRISQNVLTACSFDMRFLYVLPGWEGSAADSRIFEDARRSDFAVGEGVCYLADAGFPMCNSLLVPYHGVQYHLREWATSSQKCVLILGPDIF